MGWVDLTLSYKGTVTWTVGGGRNETYNGGLWWSVTGVNASWVSVNATLFFDLTVCGYVVATVREPWRVLVPDAVSMTSFWCFLFDSGTMLDCFNASPHAVAWLDPSPEGWSLLQRTVRVRAAWNGDYVDCTFDVSRGVVVALCYAHGEGSARRWVTVELDAPPLDLGPLRIQEETIVSAGLALLVVGVGLVVVWCGRAVLRRAGRRSSLT